MVFRLSFISDTSIMVGELPVYLIKYINAIIRSALLMSIVNKIIAYNTIIDYIFYLTTLQ